MAMAASIRCMLRKTGNINEKSIQGINRTFGSIAATNVDATSSDNKDHNNVQAQADVLFNSLPREPTTGTVSRTGYRTGPGADRILGKGRQRILKPVLKKETRYTLPREGLFTHGVPYEGCPKCCTLKWEEVDRKKKGLPILFAAAWWKAGRCHRCGAATPATAAARRRNKGKKDVTLEEFISFATYYAEKYCQTYADPADNARAVKQEVRWAMKFSGSYLQLSHLPIWEMQVI
ncbi:uncharacterized protein LOC126616336 isoform X2 [Malus sylvestris]|uniref:uncharacterized protein LOC126616336 isoform X2 n=1 Tax=Malus sylvestris TaxID=3752 RepID=UPI0021ACFD30|nr:uncharacterized protein LOC126616336 isoform X2 [Malus sylvestris]